MAVNQDVVAAMARIDAATSVIAQRIADLAGQIGTGMSPEDVATVVSGLQAEADRLEGMASDPANPVPDVPPQPAPDIPPASGGGTAEPGGPTPSARKR